MTMSLTMMDVSRVRLLVVVLFSTFALASCKEPDVQVSTLGKKLPAPILTGSSPFDQEFEDQGYARLQGTCDTRVGTILVSFNKESWHSPPTNPDVASTTLAAGTKNDTDCADGKFDIYITRNDLYAIWGITSGEDGDDVNYIQVKGTTLVGDTEILTLEDLNKNNGAASLVHIEKTYPRGFAGKDQCETFRIFLSTANGQEASHSSDVSFKLTQQSPSATGTSFIAAFKSRDDCLGGAAPRTAFTIPAGRSSLEVFYRFPTSVDILDFGISNLSALTAGPVTRVTLRSLDLYRWLDMEEYLHQIYKNKCYPIKFTAKDYYGNIALFSTLEKISLFSSNSSVKFYSDSGCTGEQTEFTPGSGASSLQAWIKYIPSGAELSNFTSFDLATNNPESNLHTYDFSPVRYHVDLSESGTANKVGFWGQRELENGTCGRYQIVAMNENNTPIAVNGSLLVNLSTEEVNVGEFYFSQADCEDNISSISQIGMSAGQIFKEVFFRPSTAPGKYHFKVTAAGMSYERPELNVTSTAYRYEFLPFDFAAGACKPVQIKIVDRAGLPVMATRTYTAILNSSPGPSRLYSDPSCETSSGTVSIVNGTNMGTFYVNTTDLSGTTLTISAVDTAGPGVPLQFAELGLDF